MEIGQQRLTDLILLGESFVALDAIHADAKDLRFEAIEPRHLPDEASVLLGVTRREIQWVERQNNGLPPKIRQPVFLVVVPSKYKNGGQFPWL